jgi:hypothetical protein
MLDCSIYNEFLASGYTAQRVLPGTPHRRSGAFEKPSSHADLSIAIRNIMPRRAGKPAGDEVIAGA